MTKMEALTHEVRFISSELVKRVSCHLYSWSLFCQHSKTGLLLLLLLLATAVLCSPYASELNEYELKFINSYANCLHILQQQKQQSQIP